jgi:osmotically-inducible protein OsmY
MKTRTILAALGCAAATLAFGQSTSSSVSTTTSDRTSLSTRQSASSSGPTVQGITTYTGSPRTAVPGASVDGTAAASDPRLMDEVVSALAADPTLKGANVNVTIDNGSVTLSGATHDSAQAERARQVAEGIAGQGKVTSSLETR